METAQVICLQAWTKKKTKREKDRKVMGFQIRGEVIKGAGYPHKPPTANVVMQKSVPNGVYLGDAYLVDEMLGKACVWVQPHQPHVAEVYISKWSGDLLNMFVTVKGMKGVNRKEMMTFYDKAMA